MNKNEKGFGAVEGLVIVVIVGLIGFVGWYVWHNRTAKVTSSPGTSTPLKTTTTAKPTSSTNNEYLVIKEWGVKLPLSDSVKGLRYTEKDNTDNQGSTATFRTDALDASGLKGCTSNSVNIVRGNKSQIVPSETGTSTSTYKDVYDSVKANPTAANPSPDYPNVQVGDYYYVIPGYRGGSCVQTNDKTLLDAESAATTSIWKAINKMIVQ